MKLFKASFLTAALLSTFLSGCGGGKSNYHFDETRETEPAALPHGPIFDPAGGNIPMPNDLAFKYDPNDGTINIDNPSGNPVIAAINELDGASTSNPMITTFGMPLDPATLIVGDTIRIFEVSRAGPAVTGVLREVTAAEIIVKVVGENVDTLALIPFPPLKESTSYEVVLTTGIKDTSGKPAQTSTVYNLVRSSAPLTGPFAPLEPVRQHINNLELIAQSKGIDVNSIVMSWAFGTQSTTAVLNGVAAGAAAGTLVMAPVPAAPGVILNTSHVAPANIDYAGLAFTGAADIHIGTLEVPYYLEAPSAQNPLAPINGYWKGLGGSSLTRYNTTPIATQQLTIPAMMTVPNANSGKVKPAAGWPIVIYQHGITRVRTDVLIYADSLAKAGFAVIAIDLPLHGVTDASSPFYASNTPFPTDVEPTFDVDYMNNTTQAPGPDGMIDSSGAHYINLQSLLTSRDNTRQGVSNLLVLRRSLGSISDIDASNVSFIAHSLGGIVGVPYLGVEDMVTPSALITTGASITTIIRDSATYGPAVKGAFLAGDSARTEADYVAFLQGAQWVLDSSDPVSFAIDAAITHPIYMTEIIGDGATHSFDTTVPNSSTEMLAALLQAQPATMTSNTVAAGAPKIIRFVQGDHSSILDPTDDVPAGIDSYINVFEEMHSELSSFMISGGTKVDVSDFGIILH